LEDSEINVRRMETSDIDEVVDIQTAITGKEESTPWRRMVEDYLDRGCDCCFVAELDGKIIGSILGDMKKWSFGVERSGWIEVVGVSPRHMGEGVGKLLGEALLSYFTEQGIERIYTSVAWDSGDMVAFFKSIGFTRSDFMNLERRMK